jgi:hypothetical protein
MRAYEFVNEILDVRAPAPDTTWIHGHDKDSGIGTSIAAWKDPTGRDIEHWFTRDPSGKVGVEFTRSDAVGNPAYQKTGTGRGKQASIMSGVTQNFRDYIKNNPDVEHYKFSSSDDSRTRLYNKMIDRLAPQMGFVGTSTHEPDLYRTVYQLTKAKPGETHKPLSTPREPSTTRSQSITKGSAGGTRGGGSGSSLSDPANWQSGIEDVFQTSFDPKRTAQQMKYDAFKRGY